MTALLGRREASAARRVSSPVGGLALLLAAGAIGLSPASGFAGQQPMTALAPVEVVADGFRDAVGVAVDGDGNVFVAGPKLIQLGPKIVIIKKGAHGAVLFHPEGLFALPAYPVTQVQDPTGAGDSFAGALIGALAAAGDTGFATLRRALAYATVTASLTVEALGVDRLETAGRAVIDQRFTDLVRMTRID